MTTKTRTDCHRPGAIVPSAYAYEATYDCGGGEDEPPWGFEDVNPAVKAALAEGRKVFGEAGKCGVCGANFRYGDLWSHVPTGDLVHLGHDCASKYSLLANRPGFDAHLEALKRGRAARIEAERRKIVRERFCSSHPGLEEALATEHYISRDLSFKLGRYGSLSDKQIALAFKLAEDAKTPRPVEKLVPAPVADGRQTVRGRVVSLKWVESQFGGSTKMTVKVETPEGNWLAWGTRPATLGDCEVGDLVEFDAALKAGRDAHFAIVSRPTKGSIVEKKVAKEAA